MLCPKASIYLKESIKKGLLQGSVLGSVIFKCQAEGECFNYSVPNKNFVSNSLWRKTIQLIMYEEKKEEGVWKVCLNWQEVKK